MKVEKRWEKIEEILSKSGSLSVQELASMLSVSETTIRRDLVKMENQNMIKRLWGGASTVAHETNENAHWQDDYILNFKRGVDVKRALSQHAASMIKDNDCIFLDAGSTTSFIVEYITAHNITVVTNGINNFQTLAQKNIKTYVPNGYINFGSSAIMSSETSGQLANLNFDLAFLGTSGLDEYAGYTTRNEHDAAIKKSVLKRCSKSYILCDHSKFGLKRLYTFSGLDVTTLITDKKPDFTVENLILVDAAPDRNANES